MAFPSELESFRAYADTFPDQCVLLVDTYDTLGSGVPNAITVARELRARGHALQGIRLDSGDLAHLSKEARTMLDGAGFPEVKIVASNELDEGAIAALRREGARIDIFGVGTRLVTAAGEGGGALGTVYKLVEIKGDPRIKISSETAKSTLPGRKRLWRASLRGSFEMDVLSMADEVPRPGDRVFDLAGSARGGRIGRIDLGSRSVVMKDGVRRARSGSRLHLRSPQERLGGEAHRRLPAPAYACR
jgi:nicotinate phosphoribosyltransferase